MHDLYEPTGAWASTGDMFWVIMDGTYFLFWVNILLGTFNAIPLGFLDGGQMLRHTLLHRGFRKLGLTADEIDVEQDEGGRPHYRTSDPDRQEELEAVQARVDRIQGWIATGLIAVLLFPFLYPRILGLLG